MYNQNKVYNSYNQVLKSGGIIIRMSGDQKEILLLQRLNHRDWSFPKGHVELGESMIEAAQREILEETGYETKFIKDLPANEYFNAKSKEHTRCDMFLFSPGNKHQSREVGNINIEWVPLNAVEDYLTYPSLKDYFRGVRHLL